MTEDNPGVKLYTQQNHKYYRINILMQKLHLGGKDGGEKKRGGGS